MEWYSDRGSQYASHDYQKRLADHGLVCSMSRKAECWDNAVAESFFGTLKQEPIYHDTYATREEARQTIFEYIEVFYNRKRRHSTLGYMTPTTFEANVMAPTGSSSTATVTALRAVVRQPQNPRLRTRQKPAILKPVRAPYAGLPSGAINPIMGGSNRAVGDTPICSKEAREGKRKELFVSLENIGLQLCQRIPCENCGLLSHFQQAHDNPLYDSSREILASARKR